MTEQESDLSRFIRERNMALESLDIAWARKNSHGRSDDKTLLIALHKTRIECTDMSSELRRESIKWLRQRGFRRVDGREIPQEPQG